MLLEICTGSLHSALAAQAGGAHRIELCDNLAEGGTTPSPGTIIQTIRRLSIPVFILIRPRPGDFVYSAEEFESMKDDILFCKEHKAKGVVLGILQEDGRVDVERTGDLVQLARPMQVTFHRAFDVAADPYRALEDIIGLGIDRILTSGQAATACEGSPLIRKLIQESAGRISVMPGSGITENNVLEIVSATGAREIHGSLRSPVPSRMRFRNDMASIGKAGAEEYSRMETDPDRVRSAIGKIEKFSL